MIQVENISFSYPGSKHQVFTDFSLNIEGNKIYGLLGKNGTGKSTLLYLMSGLMRAGKGSISIDGINSRERNPLLQEIFMVPEEFELPAVSLDTYIRINEGFYPRFSREVLNSCLKDFDLPLSLHLKELSMGQKKKVLMSYALAAGTRYLFMDEPTNGLDIPSKSQFRRVVANNMGDDRTIIISTHQVHDVETLLDHILILSENRMLLNASTADICTQYSFGLRPANEMDDSVIYAEPTLQGNAVVARRKKGEPETPLNLELLFSAVAEKKVLAD
ncbi:MAG: ATP-binding cassette domain-containing protein [Prevotella sp.]